MGFLVNSIQAMNNHFKEGKYEVYSILLVQNKEILKEINLFNLLDWLDQRTGPSIACYIFCPKSWIKTERAERYGVYSGGILNIEKEKQLLDSLINGSNSFLDELSRNIVSTKESIESIENLEKVRNLRDLGLMFFGGEKGIEKPSNCFYVPLSPKNLDKQLSVMFDEFSYKHVSSYESFISHLENRTSRILRLLKIRKKYPFGDKILVPLGLGLLQLAINIALTVALSL